MEGLPPPRATTTAAPWQAPSAPPTAAPSAPPAAAAPSAPPVPAHVTTGYKSDLPEGWEPPPALPPGAVRLEDVKPGTRPAPATRAAPAAPAPRETIIEEDVEIEEEAGTPAKTRQRWGM